MRATGSLLIALGLLLLLWFWASSESGTPASQPARTPRPTKPTPLMPQAGEQGHWWYYPPGMSPLQPGVISCTATLQPIGGTDLHISICTPPTTAPAAMQLHIVKKLRQDSKKVIVGLSVQQSVGRTYSAGIPRILCDLDAAQAASVMKYGIPDSLLERMLAATDKVSWLGWRGTDPPTADIRIDPTPHFVGR